MATTQQPNPSNKDKNMKKNPQQQTGTKQGVPGQRDQGQRAPGQQTNEPMKDIDESDRS